MERGQLDQLDASTNEIGRARDEDGMRLLARQGLETGIDLAAGIGLQYLDLQPRRSSRCFDVS